jgi:hypothetical protein
MLALFEIIDSDRIPMKGMTKCDSHTNNIVCSSDNQGHYETNHSAAESVNSLHSSPSLTSVPASKEWFRRLASYASMTPSSLGSDSNHEEISNDMVEWIIRCLQKCGEEREYMPLFKVVFTTLNDISENRYTRLLDGRARDILLTGVVTRMMYYVSKHVELVLVCDDIQCKYQN